MFEKLEREIKTKITRERLLVLAVVGMLVALAVANSFLGFDLFR